jgi:hypothetical protein
MGERKWRLFRTVILPLAMLAAIIFAIRPIETFADNLSDGDTTVGAMLESLYYDGGITLCVNLNADGSAIKDNSMPALEKIVQILNLNPALNLDIKTYFKDSGDAASKQALSEKRARAVMAAMVAQGIEAKRLNVIKPLRLKASEEKSAEAPDISCRVELHIKPAFPEDTVPLTAAKEHFGIQVYPGAQLDEGQTRYTRNIMGINQFCYISQDDFRKIVAFYGKIDGFMPFGGDDSSAVYIREIDGGILRVAITCPWIDPRTNKRQSSVLIQILKD